MTNKRKYIFSGSTYHHLENITIKFNHYNNVNNNSGLTMQSLYY